MKKRVLITSLLIIMMFLLSSCKTTTTIYENGEYTKYDQFVVIEEKNNFDEGILYTVYDKDTKVMYYIIINSYRCGITPIYNTDGTIKVYEEKE
ncbi:MAG: hypothetical protein VZS44_10070 [Bacilli bacterium]|nr:hypothetical protein [Bacilli bacterium]